MTTILVTIVFVSLCRMNDRFRKISTVKDYIYLKVFEEHICDFYSMYNNQSLHPCQGPME